MSSASIVPHLQAIPSALLFLVPLFSLFIFYVAVSRPNHPFHAPGSFHHQGISRVHVFWSYFAISSLGILSLVTGALGLTVSTLHHPKFAFRSSFGLIAAEAVFASLLKFQLGVSIIYLVTVSIPYHTISVLNLCLYNTIIAFVLLSATLISVLYPFIPFSIPPLLAPILTLAFTVLSLPLLAFLLLAQRRLFRSTISHPPPRSPTSKREKGAYIFADEPLMVNLSLARGGDAERHTSNTRPAFVVPKARYVSLFGAQISVALSSGLAIGSAMLSERNLGRSTPIAVMKPRADLVFDTLQSVLLVLGILCIMSAFLFNSTPAPSRIASSPSAPAHFTPPPTRLSRSPNIRSHYPPRNRQNHHPPTPTPSQLSEDFRNLRDPFASPNPGVAFGETGRACSDTNANVPGREYPSIGRVISGHVGSSTVHTTADTSSCLSVPAHLRSYRSAKTKPLSVPVLNLPKPKRHRRRAKKGSSQGLIVSTHPPPSFPFPTHAKCHDRNAPKSKSSTTGSGTSSSSSTAEDAEFDPEEAILTQLLLRSLDSESQAGSGTGEGEGEGESLELADLLPPPATHRFTQDSTSTGATLCDSEVFRLGRGSVSTAFSSPPASPGGAKEANRSEGG